MKGQDNRWVTSTNRSFGVPGGLSFLVVHESDTTEAFGSKCQKIWR
jgi:hypothetical protein